MGKTTKFEYEGGQNDFFMNDTLLDIPKTRNKLERVQAAMAKHTA